ncbi:MAG: hypothetical protein Q4C48_05875 [Lachnospiraceae bacterium]|nr:hypothetical protein [Lachnospiraceae bacterium]
MKRTKHSLLLGLALLLLGCMISPVSAETEMTEDTAASGAAVAISPAPASTVLSTEYEYHEDGSYVETVIEGAPISKGGIATFSNIITITRTKTRNCYSADGTLLVTASITALFKYNGTSVTCSAFVPSASAPHKYWFIQELSGSRYKNTATTYVVALHKRPFISDTYEMNITITCTAAGYVY